jgi:hypothetical protein
VILAEAFMKRNDLKKEIAGLLSAASSNLWQDKSMPINFEKGIKVNPRIAYSQALQKMNELQQLNVAIAKANLANNELLRDLETTTAKISLMELILAAAQRYPGDKHRERTYDSSGDIITENEWLIDPQEVQEELKSLQSRKRDLEKSLAHNNFTTEVP